MVSVPAATAGKSRPAGREPRRSPRDPGDRGRPLESAAFFERPPTADAWHRKPFFHRPSRRHEPAAEAGLPSYREPPP